MHEEMPKVVMSSAEFGAEDFEYETIEEARDGFERLKKKCAESFKEDGIERRLLLVIADWQAGTDIDDGDATDGLQAGSAPPG
jgi:hypothetical protein